jgi:hypothetical protein
MACYVVQATLIAAPVRSSADVITLPTGPPPILPRLKSEFRVQQKQKENSKKKDFPSNRNRAGDLSVALFFSITACCTIRIDIASSDTPRLTERDSQLHHRGFTWNHIARRFVLQARDDFE